MIYPNKTGDALGITVIAIILVKAVFPFTLMLLRKVWQNDNQIEDETCRENYKNNKWKSFFFLNIGKCK